MRVDWIVKILFQPYRGPVQPYTRYNAKRFASREIVLKSPIQLSLSNRKYRGVDRAQYQTRNNLTLLFHSRSNPLPPFSLVVTKPLPTNTTTVTIAGEQQRPPSPTPSTSPTPSSPSRPTSTLNSPHFPRFITCHHRPARAVYIYLPTAARLG